MTRPRLLSAALATALIASAAGCSAGDTASDERQVRSGLAAIAGVPQDGYTLGRPGARWTLSVISAPTSYELDHLVTVLPALGERFVRGGRVKLQMRTPTMGPYGADGDERAAAGALLAAGLQRRYWDALVRFVATYDGEVTTSGLTALLRRSGVADIDRALADRSSPLIRAALDRADADAEKAGGTGHLIYLLTSDGGDEFDLTRQAEKGRLPAMIERTLVEASDGRRGADAVP